MNRSESIPDGDLSLFLEAIYVRFHYDFRGYSPVSLKRRVAAAMRRERCATVSDLKDKLLREPEAFSSVVDALTVQVSDMFRDPPFFRCFRDDIVPHLRTYPSVRLWVAGCSSGEEVYSFAIVLREEALLDRSLIYATDISAAALERARSGVYALDRIPAFTDNHARSGGVAPLSSHYETAHGCAVFDEALRSKVVFSDHSLATDSVFAEVQVVSCRNVLIYFNPELRNRAVRLFRDALARRGFLGLGSAESLHFTTDRTSFEGVEREGSWYRRCDPRW